MVRFKPSLLVFLLISAALCAVLPAQTNPDLQASADKGHPVPAAAPFPFAINPGDIESARSIRILSPEQMTRHDRDLKADAEASIQEKAGFQNLEFNQGSWTYRQLVCPALPNHLFLRFSRDEGTGAMSMFSAAIPRDGDGKVRIIPIVRKGYSLFSPAPIGPLTIVAFNHIRAEEKMARPADWLGTGLCYAALAGANPQPGELPPPPQEGQLAPQPSETAHVPVTMEPTLFLTAEGGAIVRFADISTMPHPMEWSMMFDRSGKLTKATHAPAYVVRHLPNPVPVLDLREVDATRARP